MNVTITWRPDAEEPLLLMATFDGAALGITRYHCRFGIEAMFNDQKSNGFDREQTRVTDSKRIETLLIFTTLAHIFCTTEGYRQAMQGDTKKTTARRIHSTSRAVPCRVKRLQSSDSKSETPPVHAIYPLFVNIYGATSEIIKMLGTEPQKYKRIGPDEEET